jgi:hypothetical protein
MENDEKMVKISKEEYKHLLEDSDILSALNAAGVDNWDGYDYAMEMLEDNK